MTSPHNPPPPHFYQSAYAYLLTLILSGGGPYAKSQNRYLWLPTVRGTWAQILELLRSPRIDSKESIPPTYVAWRAGTTTLFIFGF